MLPARLPLNEKDRLANLHYYNILDTPREQGFDGLSDLAAQLCDCQYAMIGFIDKEREWIKACTGIQVKEFPRRFSFCAHTVLKDKIMVVPDAKKDKRFYDNPAVKDRPNIAFYAGAPIISAGGYCIGAICVMDTSPCKEFTPKHEKALLILAQQVSLLLELNAKNKVISDDSDAIVAEEKKLSQNTITEQEAEKKFIATELHENFAQTLAATKLYLDFAERSKELRPAFIHKSKDNIVQIIKDIKALSKSILPSTFRDVNFLSFMQDMLDNYGKQHQLHIAFMHSGKMDCYDSNIGLAVFRSIQHLLKNATICGAKTITIFISTHKKIRVVFTDDGKNTEMDTERKSHYHQVKTRIDLVKGQVKTTVNKKGNNKFEIEIPL